MNAHDIEDIYELSPMQEGMLFHALYAPSEGTYVTQQLFAVSDERMLRAVEWAAGQVVARHPTLRTSFHWEGTEKPLQVVHRDAPPEIRRLDWRTVAVTDCASRLETLLREDRERGFDLTAAPLLRLTTIRLGAGYQCVWTYSHLLLDGWSLSILMEEVRTFAAAHASGTAAQLPEPRSYRDYIAWLQRQNLDAAEEYWRQLLRGFTAPTPIRMRAASRATPPAERWGEAVFELGARETTALLALARSHDLTLNTCLLGAWGLILSRHSGERDVVFGVTSSGRPADLADSERIVGLFINTLPVRLRIDPRARLIPWLQHVQRVYAESREKEYAPLAAIQRWSDAPRGTPLFQTLVMLESYPSAAVSQPSPRGPRDRTGRLLQRTNYPLTVCLAHALDGLVGTLSYDTRECDEESARVLVGHLRTVLTAMATQADQPLQQLPMLTESEVQALVGDWGRAAATTSADACIDDLFEAQVRRTPAAQAIVSADGKRSLTYEELNRHANQLAHHLRELGVAPESLVGICLNRSPRSVVAMLGVLKSGAGYVPLDPAYPPERLGEMIEGTRTSIVVTEAAVQQALSGSSARRVCFDAAATRLAQADDTNPVPRGVPDNVAYVIYTSGSTGRPKGVTIQHRSAVAFLEWVRQRYSDAELSGVLATTSLSYDCSVFELLGPLSWGGRVLLADSVLHHAAMPAAADVSLVSTGPATLIEVLDKGWLSSSVRTINLGGEALPGPLVRALSSRPELRVWHLYGPTEDTSYTTCGPLCDADGDRAPLGRPLPGTSLYVLDRDGNPAPAGAIGELYVSGQGLARGYWGQGGQTAAAFIPDPFNEAPGSRMYRTGDLVTYRHDGALFFVGRRDDQVKIRGTRIEPAEIEVALGTHPAIREAAVTARVTSSEAHLVACFAVHPGKEVGPRELAQFLRSRVPESWVPSDYVVLEALPRLPNGKVDRSRLPARSDASRTASGEPPVAPRTALERRLAAIWQAVLQREGIGIHDHFFDSGGHSLLMLHLHCQLREQLGAEVALSELLRYPTIAALAERLSADRDEVQHAKVVEARARGLRRRAIASVRAEGDHRGC